MQGSFSYDNPIWLGKVLKIGSDTAATRIIAAVLNQSWMSQSSCIIDLASCQERLRRFKESHIDCVEATGMQFGIHHNTYTYDGEGFEITESLKRIVTLAEKCGYDSFWLSDHVHQNKIVGKPEEPMLDSWTVLAALTASTSRIRLGTMVTANTYRYPQMLAKIGASIDVLSNGRLFMGIGAANYGEEAAAYGLPFPPNGERLRRLSEAVQILKKMWAEDVISFDGKYYQIKNAFCNPKPIQKPHPPILVGGGGEMMTLKIVARYADACNLIGGNLETVKKKLGVLREHCKAVGRDYESILKTRTCYVAIDETKEAIENRLGEQVNTTGTIGRQSMIYGSPDEVKLEIKELDEAGVEYFIMIPEPRHTLKTIETFSDKVAKSF